MGVHERLGLVLIFFNHLQTSSTVCTQPQISSLINLLATSFSLKRGARQSNHFLLSVILIILQNCSGIRYKIFKTYDVQKLIKIIFIPCCVQFLAGAFLIYHQVSAFHFWVYTIGAVIQTENTSSMKLHKPLVSRSWFLEREILLSFLNGVLWALWAPQVSSSPIIFKARLTCLCQRVALKLSVSHKNYLLDKEH